MILRRTRRANGTGRTRYFADGRGIKREVYDRLHAEMIRNGSLSCCQTAKYRAKHSGDMLLTHSCTGDARS